MAINLSDNIFSNSPKPVEGRYVTLNGIPFSSSAHATGSLPSSVRFQGLTVLVSSSTEIAEYWWKDGTANNQLVLKAGGTTLQEGPGIDINSDYISASIGAGLEFDIDNKIRALVRTVNGTAPVNGNITTALSATLVGPSASNQGGGNNLVNSSSGAATGSITNGTVWIVARDNSIPDPNGQAFIFVSQSTDLTPPAGKWYPLDTLTKTQADSFYVKLTSGGASTSQTITSSLLISGSSVTFSSSLFWNGATSLGGGANNVLVLDNNGKLYITGAYGTGGGGTPGGADTTIQFNDGGTFSGSNNFVFNKGTNTTRLSGSLIVSNSLNLIGTGNVTGSLILSGSTPLRAVGSSSITGSLFFSGLTNLGTATNNVLVLGSDNKVYTTSSYGINPIKAGSVTSTSFGGTPKTASVTFTTAMPDANYGVSVIGGDARSWTIDSKQTTGFTINTNSSVALTANVSWIAAPANNS